VKVFGIVVVVLVLLAGIIMFTGIGGQHGPGRHMPSGEAGGQTQSFDVIENYTSSGRDLAGYTPPEAGHL
jgi:hypothetical protein